MNDAAPQNPAGPFSDPGAFDETLRAEFVGQIEVAPTRLRAAVAGLNDQQLDTPYRNWTIRQITHHIADSHLHSIIRFKWALTEEQPLIKAYEEGEWVQLDDARTGAVEPSLLLLDGLHAKWVQLLTLMTPEDYQRGFQHPQSGETVRLWAALANYAWHGQHHTAQILWLREQNGW